MRRRRDDVSATCRFAARNQSQHFDFTRVTGSRDAASMLRSSNIRRSIPRLPPPGATNDFMRTHYCGLVDETLIDHTVTLCGWVDTRRDHGAFVFIDLRDHEGIVQIVVDRDVDARAFELAT